MTKTRVLLFLVFLALLACGCHATRFVTYQFIWGPSQSFNEFQGSVAQTDVIQKGAWVGTVEKKGVKYLQYQFPDLLIPADSRLLNIYVPVDGDAKAWIDDSFTRKAEIAPAQLFRVSWGGPRCGPTSEYLRLCYPSADPVDCSKHSMYLERREGLYYMYWESGSRELRWKRYEVIDRLPWRKRSRALYACSHLLYLISIPVDIVTFPVQVFLPIG